MFNNVIFKIVANEYLISACHLPFNRFKSTSYVKYKKLNSLSLSLLSFNFSLTLSLSRCLCLILTALCVFFLFDSLFITLFGAVAAIHAVTVTCLRCRLCKLFFFFFSSLLSVTILPEIFFGVCVLRNNRRHVKSKRQPKHQPKKYYFMQCNNDVHFCIYVHIIYRVCVCLPVCVCVCLRAYVCVYVYTRKIV